LGWGNTREVWGFIGGVIMNTEIFQSASLTRAIDALHADLLNEGGPTISTMRNYRFAILQYEPKEEFLLRERIRWLTDELQSRGWSICSISLHQLLLDRLKQQDPKVRDSWIRMEQRLYAKDPDRGLNHLKEKIAQYVEGPNGIVQDVISIIGEFAEKAQDREDRVLILLGRAGALYPFLRSSAMLKYLDGKTFNLPVVLLYPGERKELSALSFMGELQPDRDYRPRIYS
jgi:hypothetical protein